MNDRCAPGAGRPCFHDTELETNQLNWHRNDQQNCSSEKSKKQFLKIIATTHAFRHNLFSTKDQDCTLFECASKICTASDDKLGSPPQAGVRAAPNFELESIFTIKFRICCSVVTYVEPT